MAISNSTIRLIAGHGLRPTLAVAPVGQNRSDDTAQIGQDTHTHLVVNALDPQTKRRMFDPILLQNAIHNPRGARPADPRARA
jgi:hypothetical protein